MTFDTITLGPFPLYAPITMLVVDTILYTLLAAYLDNIIPRKIKKPVYMYLINKQYFKRFNGNQIQTTVN